MPDTAQSGPSSRLAPWWAALAFGLLATAVTKYPDLVHAKRASPVSDDGTEDDRGRAADKPTAVPAKGWKEILWRVYQSINDDRVLAVAAGVTFYGLLAIFPAIVALVSLYGLFADASTISTHIDALKGVLPGGAIDIVGEQIKRITSKPGGSLGFGFLFGLGVALWSANAGMKAVFDALNVCFEEKEKRSFIVLNAMSLAFTIVAIAALLLILGAVVVIPVILNVIPLGGVASTLLNLLRWPILLVVVALGLAVLFRFGPSRAKPQWRWVSVGSAFSAIMWLVGSGLFSLYVSRFGSYNETYGSLGAAIGFMTWIWISTIIVLVGAEINAQMEHQTARDTTDSANKPLGMRGAKMADTVAG